MFTHLQHNYQFPTLTRAQIRGQRWYNIDNNQLKYPSVTTVLSSVEKPGLEAWKAAVGKDRAAKEAARCAQRGTAIHEMIERYIKNDPNALSNQPAELIPLFNKLKIRLNKVDNIVCQEKTLVSHDLRLAGTVDCIAEYDGKLSIIDFKTSNDIKQQSVIEDYFLQCTAYAIMYNEMFNCDIDNFVILITPEKSSAMSMVFQKKIYDYVVPLLQRIDTFKQKNSLK